MLDVFGIAGLLSPQFRRTVHVRLVRVPKRDMVEQSECLSVGSDEKLPMGLAATDPLCRKGSGFPCFYVVPHEVPLIWSVVQDLADGLGRDPESARARLAAINKTRLLISRPEESRRKQNEHPKKHEPTSA